ncbi:hypothetical protein EAb13_CDS0046 [Acinetobacter phage EAb13]|nr:hypothetical protein EAb13_CDS0046 [Acinetobacter phage EAb13]
MVNEKETVAYVWYRSLNNVVMEIHNAVYKGNRQSCKYKIGRQLIATVENDKVSKIADFSKGRVIVPDHEKKTVSYMVMAKETTLAEDVRNRIEAAIKATVPSHIFTAYAATGIDNWIPVRIENIYKYGLRTANPELH